MDSSYATYQAMVNAIWRSMSVDEAGSVFMHHQGQTVKYENLRYINKDGKSFIHDSATNKLYDQMFNYYHEGRYYNPFGQLVQDVDDPNIIDGTFREVVESDEVAPQAEKQRKYKAKRGPKLKEKPLDVPQAEVDIPNEPPQASAEMPKIETQQEKVDDLVSQLTKKELSDAGQEAIEKGTKEAGQEAIEKVAQSIPTGGGGKYLALALGALAVGYAMGSDKKKEPVKTQRAWNAQNRMSYDAPINDPQAMQMAQAMSQYRYGSRLPGFN